MVSNEGSADTVADKKAREGGTAENVLGRTPFPLPRLLCNGGKVGGRDKNKISTPTPQTQPGAPHNQAPHKAPTTQKTLAGSGGREIFSERGGGRHPG